MLINKARNTRNIYSLNGIRHSYANNPTLDIDTLDIPEGCVMGLIGPNGSGKSTLLKVLALLEPYTSGTLSFAEESVAGRESKVRQQVTLLLQEPYLLRRSVHSNIAYGLRQRGVSEAEIELRVDESLLSVGLNSAEFAERPWYRLSGGEAQRVALAARLALRPKVLLLDEPTANVDESSAMKIREAVAHAWREYGTTIIVATHDLVWLHEIADRIVSLYSGRIIGDGAENLIRAQWRQIGVYFVFEFNGQRIDGISDNSSSASECASLNPSDISISPTHPEVSDRDNLLIGRIVQMSVERSSGSILVVTDCDGIYLRSRLSLERARDLNLYPAATVYLTFSKRALSFI